MADYKQGLKTNVPKGEFAARFNDGILDKDQTQWLKNQNLRPYVDKIDEKGKTYRTLGDPGSFPQFNFNQMTVQEFFASVTDKSANNMYAGMLERIGRTTIWADDLADNEFLRFMKSPLEYGAAIEDGAFEDIKSRPWSKNFQSDGKTPNPLFKTEVPRYINSLAEVNFSREIPLKMSEIEYRKCCQTAQTVGDVAGVLIGKINVTFIDDMYEACKQYFLGCLRIAPEESGTAMPLREIFGIDAQGELTGKLNPMVAVIEYTEDRCPEDKILGAIHQITDSEFYYKSRKYNPAARYTRSKQMTLVLPKKWLYPLFLEKFAATYHPEYIKLGEDVQLLYVDAMPEMITSMFPPNYEFLGMLVDDRALGITPLNGGFSVNTFFNPQEGSTSYFGHYEFIFSFLPFFNRKYLFLKKK